MESMSRNIILLFTSERFLQVLEMYSWEDVADRVVSGTSTSGHEARYAYFITKHSHLKALYRRPGVLEDAKQRLLVTHTCCFLSCRNRCTSVLYLTSQCLLTCEKGFPWQMSHCLRTRHRCQLRKVLSKF